MSQDKQDKQKLVERFAKVVDRCDRVEDVVVVKELVKLCEYEVQQRGVQCPTKRS